MVTQRLNSELKSLTRLLIGWMEFQRETEVVGFLSTGAAMPKKKGKRRETLEDIRRDLVKCKRCFLYKGRTTLVFGTGNPHAKLMFIGEAPGRDEDLQGEPFVGRAGKLLDKIIEAMGMKRSDVYIGNVVKSRPPNNRAPTAEEIKECIPFLNRQIAAINPEIIVTLGATAALALLGLQEHGRIGDLRGKWQEHLGIPVMPTYHPAFLLRNPAMKKVVWEDMKKVMVRLKEG